MLKQEQNFLNQLRETRPEVVEALAQASHDNGYYLTDDVAGPDGNSGVIHDSGSILMVPELSEESLQALSEKGRAFYNNRYENFKYVSSATLVVSIKSDLSGTKLKAN